VWDVYHRAMAKIRKSTKRSIKAVPKRVARSATKSKSPHVVGAAHAFEKNPYAMSASRVVELAMAAGIIDKNGKLTPTYR